MIDAHPDVVAELTALLDGYRARDYQPDSRTSVVIGADLLERLQQLGYVGGAIDDDVSGR